MKKMLKAVLLIGLFLFLLTSSVRVMAQGAPPPPPAGGHGQSGDLPAGGNAPIGGGLVILLLMGAAYAGKKIYNLQTEEAN